MILRSIVKRLVILVAVGFRPIDCANTFDSVDAAMGDIDPKSMENGPSPPAPAIVLQGSLPVVALSTLEIQYGLDPSIASGDDPAVCTPLPTISDLPAGESSSDYLQKLVSGPYGLPCPLIWVHHYSLEEGKDGLVLFDNGTERDTLVQVVCFPKTILRSYTPYRSDKSPFFLSTVDGWAPDHGCDDSKVTLLGLNGVADKPLDGNMTQAKGTFDFGKVMGENDFTGGDNTPCLYRSYSTCSSSTNLAINLVRPTIWLESNPQSVPVLWNDQSLDPMAVINSTYGRWNAAGDEMTVVDKSSSGDPTCRQSLEANVGNCGAQTTNGCYSSLKKGCFFARNRKFMPQFQSTPIGGVIETRGSLFFTMNMYPYEIPSFSLKASGPPEGVYVSRVEATLAEAPPKETKFELSLIDRFPAYGTNYEMTNGFRAVTGTLNGTQVVFEGNIPKSFSVYRINLPPRPRDAKPPLKSGVFREITVTLTSPRVGGEAVVETTAKPTTSTSADSKINTTSDANIPSQIPRDPHISGVDGPSGTFSPLIVITLALCPLIVLLL